LCNMPHNMRIQLDGFWQRIVLPKTRDQQLMC